MIRPTFGCIIKIIGSKYYNMWRRKRVSNLIDYTSTIEIEKPIFSNNGTRRFIVDCIIDISCVKHCSGLNSNNNGYRLVSVKSFSGRDIQIIQNSIARRIIVEIKPQLLSISSAISQVKTYQNFLRYNRWVRGIRNERLSNADLVILTLDTNDAFDKMLESQSINIFHIPPKETLRMVVDNISTR